MVCIAAFIILCLVSVFVAFLSIFRRDIGKRYWKVFRKSWACVGKRVTLQKCETGFKDDVKNTLLAKVMIKRPKLVKPLSIGIEVASVLIVFITVWSLVEGAKAGLALWTLGTCNVQRPEACSLSAEVCSIDAGTGPQNPVEYVQYWFSDWGEIFGAVPDKFRDWNVEQFDFKTIDVGDGEAKAIDIFDPGCIVCLQSFKNQFESGYFDEGKVKLVVFPIQNGDGEFKYRNSKLIAGYVYGAEEQGVSEDGIRGSYEIIKRIFLEKDEKSRSYQSLFNDWIGAEEAEAELKSWLKEFRYTDEQIEQIASYAHSEEYDQLVAENNDIVVNNIHAKGIPTMIYDGKKHTGRYEAK